MNTSSDEFLARAAFPQDQNGIIVLADLFDDFVNPLHFFRSTNQSAKTGASAQLLAEQAVFLLQLDRVHDAFEARAHFIEAKGLSDIVVGAHAGELNGGIDAAVLSEDQDRHFRMQLLDAFEKIDAAAAR